MRTKESPNRSTTNPTAIPQSTRGGAGTIPPLLTLVPQGAAPAIESLCQPLGCILVAKEEEDGGGEKGKLNGKRPESPSENPIRANDIGQTKRENCGQSKTSKPEARSLIHLFLLPFKSQKRQTKPVPLHNSTYSCSSKVAKGGRQ